MSRWKKSFTAAAICFSVPLLGSGLFAKVFAGAAPKPALPTLSEQAQPGAVQWSAAENSYDDFVPISLDEATEKSLGAQPSVTTRLRYVIVGGFFLGTPSAPKVSRYLAKSVLIL